MTSVSFGNNEEHAVVMYDRKTQVCVIVANSYEHLQDAIAVVNSLKAEKVIVIAPQGANLVYDQLTIDSLLEVYEYSK